MALKIDFMSSFDRESITAELLRIASFTGKKGVTLRDIERYGRLSSSTVKNRFGSIRSANEQAGLEASYVHHWTDEELLSALNDLWIRTEADSGRSPLVADVKRYGLPFHACTVMKRFGSWRKAKLAVSQGYDRLPSPQPRRARRRSTIPVGRRYQVLRRDNFTCQVCKTSGVPIEVDHIIPISRGGTDRIENLQTLCVPCNRGKSNRI